MSLKGSSWTHLALCIAALTAAAGLCGCDDVSYREGIRGAQPPLFQPQTMRSLVSPKGIQTLYRVEYPEGMLLDYRAEPAEGVGDLDLSVGPVSRHVEVQRWEVSADQDQLEVSIEANAIAITVPVRIKETVGSRICRYSVEADRVLVSMDATLSEADGSPRLEATGEPRVHWSNPVVGLIGECPPLEDAAADDPAADDAAAMTTAEIDALFVDYLTRALEASGREAVALSPLETLGLIHEPITLSRVSNFENRRGQLFVSSRMNSPPGLSRAGLSIDLDMAFHHKRAACAPALVAQTPSALGADQVPPAELERTGAEVGLSIAAPLLLRMAQTSTLAGFGCRGLEDLSLDGSGSNVRTDDLRLDDVGLGELPIGAWIEPVVSPGSLPELDLNATNGTVELQWTDLTVDFYAQMQGVPVRILELTAGVIVSFRPVSRLGGVDLAIDSVLVTNADIESNWLYEPPVDADLASWARRIMMLVLDDAFSLPLPIEPGSPLHLLDAQVRPNDLLLLFEFDRHL